MIKKHQMYLINNKGFLLGLSILSFGFTNEINAQKKTFEKRNKKKSKFFESNK